MKFIVGFGTLKFFVLTKNTSKDPVFEAVHAEVDGPGKLQGFGALNMKKKIDPEGIEKEATNVEKLMKNQPFVSDGLL